LCGSGGSPLRTAGKHYLGPCCLQSQEVAGGSIAYLRSFQPAAGSQKSLLNQREGQEGLRFIPIRLRLYRSHIETGGSWVDLSGWRGPIKLWRKTSENLCIILNRMMERSAEEEKEKKGGMLWETIRA